MNGCVYRTAEDKCEFYSDYGKGIVSYCDFADCEGKKPSNADRFRAMSDEELVEIFANNDCGYCRIHDFCFAKGSAINCEDVWLDWLKLEAETDG